MEVKITEIVWWYGRQYTLQVVENMRRLEDPPVVWVDQGGCEAGHRAVLTRTDPGYTVAHVPDLGEAPAGNQFELMELLASLEVIRVGG